MSKTPKTLEAAATELVLATGQLTRRLRAESASHELSWSQLAVMGRLDRSGPATTADLARAEGVKPQSMGATLGALEERGFVERRPHPTDARQVILALTTEGIRVRKVAGIAKREWLAKALGKLDPVERETLLAAVDLIRRLGDS